MVSKSHKWYHNSARHSAKPNGSYKFIMLLLHVRTNVSKRLQGFPDNKRYKNSPGMSIYHISMIWLRLMRKETPWNVTAASERLRTPFITWNVSILIGYNKNCYLLLFFSRLCFVDIQMDLSTFMHLALQCLDLVQHPDTTINRNYNARFKVSPNLLWQYGTRFKIFRLTENANPSTLNIIFFEVVLYRIGTFFYMEMRYITAWKWTWVLLMQNRGCSL